ncbi:UNVERIFIED_CONTAM: hypothetical protein PYX00_001261 [Menopon gallinae]|uniref:Bee-milk protein n=1 Tax=Menopon gallinae TaxID=328185 RepID=A0AAW2IDC8_9NEOP
MTRLVKYPLFILGFLVECFSTYSPFPVFPPGEFFGVPKEPGLKEMRVVHGWRTVDFVFPSSSVRQALIRTGRFVPGNAIILDADFWQSGDEERIFVTLPKMRRGIPATLATVSQHICLDGSPKLHPYPDWSWQGDNNCEGIVSAFRTKIDECGRLWVIDSGVTEILEDANRDCPPKILVFDLDTDQLIMKYIFPQDVLEYGSLLVTIAVDNRLKHCRDTFAYVADVTTYGLIVFNSRTRSSWRVSSNYFYPFPLYGTLNVAGQEFDLMDGVIGLALSPINKYGDRTLYFHSLASVREAKVSANLLRNESNFEDGHNYVSKKFYITDEVRESQSVAQDMSKRGVLFFGLLSPVSVACWNSKLPYVPFNIVTIAQNNETLRFSSGVKVVRKNGVEELLVTSSRFSSYFLGNIDERDVNFRIFERNRA